MWLKIIKEWGGSQLQMDSLRPFGKEKLSAIIPPPLAAGKWRNG
jgi:hypothetical protein